MIYKAMQYSTNNENFLASSVANLEPAPNRNAKIGQSRANVYANGPQYETEIPEKHKNSISTILSTHM